MEVLLLLIPLSFFMAGMGLLAFLWANRRGQFDDLQGPAEAILYDEEIVDTHQEHGGWKS